MKVRCLLIRIVLSSILSVHAQEQEEMRQEISISYGVAPNSIWLDAISDVVPAMFGQKSDNETRIGSLSAEYFYHTSKVVGVGAVASFSHYSEDVLSKDVLKSHRNKGYYTLMPAVKFNWLRKQHWGMYNKIALGATYAQVSDEGYSENGLKDGNKETNDDVMFNFQASLGVEAGSNHWWGFAEFGIGEQGVGLLGVRYKF